MPPIDSGPLDKTGAVREDIRAIREKADGVKRRWPFHARIMDWLSDLLGETVRAGARVRLPESGPDMRGDGVSGHSRFTWPDVPLDLDSTLSLWVDLTDRSERVMGRDMSGMKRLFSGSAPENLFLIRSAPLPESRDLESACREHGCDPRAVRLLLRLALRPSLKRLAGDMAAEMTGDWPFGYCPLCGVPPSLARIDREGGGRRLYCPWCETAWSYPRRSCPFCGNHDHERMEYLFSETEEGLRLDLCRSCGQLLPTLEAGWPIGPVIPVLDEIPASHLILAIQAQA
ncbi:MAG: formate dehydrogenase accessory protein FdhE [Proteobacteria bacterium]|nr:formate dehydrogenase accessory protein FdhE [Pseudomonadota bacterium]